MRGTNTVYRRDTLLVMPSRILRFDSFSSSTQAVNVESCGMYICLHPSRYPSYTPWVGYRLGPNKKKPKPNCHVARARATTDNSSCPGGGHPSLAPIRACLHINTYMPAKRAGDVATPTRRARHDATTTVKNARAPKHLITAVGMFVQSVPGRQRDETPLLTPRKNTRHEDEEDTHFSWYRYVLSASAAGRSTFNPFPRTFIVQANRRFLCVMVERLLLSVCCCADV